MGGYWLMVTAHGTKMQVAFESLGCSHGISQLFKQSENCQNKTPGQVPPPTRRVTQTLHTWQWCALPPAPKRKQNLNPESKGMTKQRPTRQWHRGKEVSERNLGS